MLKRLSRAVVVTGLAGCMHEASLARVSPSAAPTSSPAIEGDVVDGDGQPVAGALVSAWSHFDLDAADPDHDVTSDARGRFSFGGLSPGRYGVTATFAGKTAAYKGGVEVPGRGAPSRVSLRMAGPSETIAGTVRDENGAPARARMMAASGSDNENEVYVTRADVHGSYALTLPAQPIFHVVADAAPRPRAYLPVRSGSVGVDFTLEPVPAPRPGDATLVAWLRARATPLTVGGDLDPVQAQAFGSIVADAPLVAMGEATHGSAEFPDWRRRVFEALVRDKGFSVYAVETGFPDAFALDDYVVSGKGDPVEAIRALVTTKDETTETLALVRWMRAYNADPNHATKLHFAGFDVYTPHAVPRILSYLAEVDAAAIEDARPALSRFADVGCDSTYPALSEAVRARTRRSIDALLERFDVKHAAYARASSEEEWARVRQLVRVVLEAETAYGDDLARDAFLAENIDWLTRHYRPGTKVLLDAHNAHISATRTQMRDMGQRLRKEWGRGYVTIGFAFGEGAFLAMDWSHGQRSNAVVPLSVGRAPITTFDGALSLANLPAFVVDLRAADGSVAAWLRSPQRARWIGLTFFGDGDDSQTTLAPSRAFDAVIYVDRVSPVHALPPAE